MAAAQKNNQLEQAKQLKENAMAGIEEDKANKNAGQGSARRQAGPESAGNKGKASAPAKAKLSKQ